MYLTVYNVLTDKKRSVEDFYKHQDNVIKWFNHLLSNYEEVKSGNIEFLRNEIAVSINFGRLNDEKHDTIWKTYFKSEENSYLECHNSEYNSPERELSDKIFEKVWRLLFETIYRNDLIKE